MSDLEELKSDHEPSQRKKSKDDIRYRLSQVILHVGRRERQSLFSRLTGTHREEIQRLLAEPPKFYRERKDASKHIELDPEIEQLLPQEFFDHPTQWIEQQPNIDRGHTDSLPWKPLPSGEHLSEVLEKPYDVSKVKQFMLPVEGGRALGIVSKRLQDGTLTEVETARKAYALGIPTPKVLGVIQDQGNVYAFFEQVKGLSLAVALERFGSEYKYFLDGPSTKFRTEDYEQFMQMHEIVQKRIVNRRRARTQMKKLWMSFRPKILTQEISYSLRHMADNIEEYSEEVLPSLRLYEPRAIEEACQQFGFGDLDDFIHHIPFPDERPWRNEDRYSVLDQQTALMDRIIEMSKAPLQGFSKQWRSLLLKELFGFDLDQERARLEVLCQEQGLPHPDLTAMNFMVHWDFKHDRPKHPDPNTPPLYIIDWEPQPAPKEESDHLA